MSEEQFSPFVHLHVHTEYSLLDGAIRLGALIKKAKEYRMDSVAITDHGTMFGCVEFYQKTRGADIRPVIGCECYIAPRSLSDKTPIDHQGVSHIVLLAKNNLGYRNLCKLASLAQLEGFYYRPRIDKEVLTKYHEGLIALSACLHGEIPRLIMNNEFEKADQAARFYQNLFGEDQFYLEIQHNGLEDQEIVNAALQDMSQRLSIPLVATNDCHYLDKKDVRAHDALLCIQTGKTLKDTNRFKFGTDQLYFKSPDEMQSYFGKYKGAIENTRDIANRCEIEFDFKTYHFPKFESDSGQSANEIFEEQARQGFEELCANLAANNPDFDRSVYQERLDYEIGVIISMGFPGYFLIVSDFIKYAKRNGIPVGPGRGSAAGSLVAYSLSITDLDPIENGLIFERFLNPARISMPDIDVDFCINGREEVFKYVVDRYGGGDYVAQIITFGKLKTRAVIRDVGRALDIPLREVDMIAKLVPDVLNIKLDEALAIEPKLQKLVDESSEVAELIDICRVLEGLPRHASTHAAGVVVSDKPLVEYLPLYRGKKGEIVTQYDMKVVEKIGLVKFDFLGLRNLTVIDHALNIIGKQNKQVPDLKKIPFDDQATYDLLSAGDTTGVFQLESSGMKDLLIRLRPQCFDDITALVALYRPGPLDSGMVDDFVERKHGRKEVAYLLPDLEKILKETYGVIVYQEQVMKIASVLANYTMAEADGLRKAMGKKIAEKMAEHRDLFMKGAVANKHPEDKAKQLFDLMEKFGGYGFNKSHSAAYALIAYQTAFLKTHYPVEFVAALLTSEMNSTDGVVKFINECRKHNIAVLPPDINESDLVFTVSNEKIRFGLGAVKNVGEGAILSILEARKEGAFENLYDFCQRVETRKVNKRVIESLIKCGAFDSTKTFRSQNMAALESALEMAQKIQKEKADPQMGLFDNMADAAVVNVPALPSINEWDDKQKLTLEKESLGFYISGHPLNRYEETIDKFSNTNSVTIKEMSDGQAIRIGGMVSAVKTIRTKRGDLMAFVTLEDLSGTVEATVFSNLYSRTDNLLINDQALFIQGYLQKEENSVKIIADDIIPIEKAEETWSASVHFKLSLEATNKQNLLDLKELCLNFKGNCSTYLHFQSKDKVEAVISLPDSFKVQPGELLVKEAFRLLGYHAVETKCSSVNDNGGDTMHSRNNFRGKMKHARN